MKTNKNKEKIVKEVTKMSKLKLVFAYVEWCGPCKLMFPFLEKVREKYGYNIEELDVDRNMEIAENLNIVGVPTILYYKDDKLIEMVKGYRTEDDILNKIKEIEVEQEI